MNYGLSTADLTAIQQIVADCPGVRKLVLFGSRAMDTYRPGSDIDLAIFGEDLTLNDVLQLRIRLDDLELLLRLDLLNYSTINNPALREPIQWVGIILFDRQVRSDSTAH